MGLKQRKQIVNGNIPKYFYGKTRDPWNYSQDAGYSQYYDYDPVSEQYKLNKFGKQANVDTAIGTIPQIMSNGIQAYGDIGNAFGPVKSVGELISESGQRNAVADGIGYQRINSIDTNGQMNALRTENHANTLKAAGSGAALGGSVGMMFGPVGGAVGAVVGGLGGAIAGLFGAKHRKRKLKQKMYEAQQLANRTNQFNEAGALSEGLSQSYYSQYGDTTDDILYAHNGKDLIQPKYGKKQ